jgi:general nucleoside transport system ATP-binding protein
MALAEAGAAVVIISRDLDEIFVLADHIAVIAGGRLSLPMLKRDSSVESIGRLMGRVTTEAARELEAAEQAGVSMKCDQQTISDRMWPPLLI